MKDIQELLNNEVQHELESLSSIELGSNEYKTVIDGIVKLADKAIEIQKVENDASEKEISREFEQTLKREQMKDNRTDVLFKNGVAIIGIILPLGVTIWGTIKSLRFEQEGTVTTMVGRGFINKLIPKK